MSVVPIDKHDRDNMLYTLDKLREGIQSGEVTGYVIVTLNKDGANMHAHNAENTDLATLIGLLEVKKADLIERMISKGL